MLEAISSGVCWGGERKERGRKKKGGREEGGGRKKTIPARERPTDDEEKAFLSSQGKGVQRWLVLWLRQESQDSGMLFLFFSFCLWIKTPGGIRKRELGVAMPCIWN